MDCGLGGSVYRGVLYRAKCICLMPLTQRLSIKLLVPTNHHIPFQASHNRCLHFHSQSLPPCQLQVYILTSVLYANSSLRSCLFTIYSIYTLPVPDPCWTRLAADNRSPDPQAPGMPPRNSLTSSFSASDANNEVVCPLRNHDGSNCRKRCLGVSTDQS